MLLNLTESHCRHCKNFVIQSLFSKKHILEKLGNESEASNTEGKDELHNFEFAITNEDQK